MQITSRQQLARVTQALNDTYQAIEKMESPKALSRDEDLIAFHYAHAAKLAEMIGAYLGK